MSNLMIFLETRFYIKQRNIKKRNYELKKFLNRQLSHTKTDFLKFRAMINSLKNKSKVYVNRNI